MIEATQHSEEHVSFDSSKDSLKYQKQSDEIYKMGGGKPLPPKVGEISAYTVEFDGDIDPLNPKNFSVKNKTLVMISVMMACFSSTYGSAMFSEATKEVSDEYNVGLEVATLGTALFIIGYASGPLLWGPLSDLYGRKMVLIPALFIYTCFNFATGAAKDIQSIIICRFFAGFNSAAPMVISGAIIAEMYGNETRGTFITIFAMLLFGGPMLAPIINSFIVQNKSLGWRWCTYISGIISALGLILIVFFYQETHQGTILKEKARILRNCTGNWSIIASHDQKSFHINDIITKELILPIKMLSTEPILLLVTIYTSFIYGLLYLLLTTIPLIFGSFGYGFNQGVSSLPYISILLGIETAGILNVWFEKRYVQIMNTTGKLVPEERLWPMMIGAIIFPLGLFWLAWTGDYPNKIHWIVPTIGAFPIGFGLMAIFLPALSYIIECYLPYAASSIAANSIARYAISGAFPLFARQMFSALGINWGGSLLGFIALVMSPVPFCFYKYGLILREKSRYSYKS